ncbi:MAG: 4'-phosphopantetheinyl transferase superfamily protein [Cyanobacteria bacterium P01_F01_bin.4]
MTWPAPPDPITLNPDQIHIWRIWLGQQSPLTYQSCLSAEEHTRANRFKFDRDRTRFIQSRGSLRHLLSRYLGCSAAEVTFTYGEYGKPQISNDPTLTFNLSHSEDLALCAVGYSQCLGIDLEYLRAITHFESLSRRCLCDSELQAIHPLAAPQAQQQFLQYWTCKEAYLKALGCGLTQSLQSVEVQLTPVAKLLSPAHPWQLKILDPAPDFVAAVVSEKQVQVTQYEWCLPTLCNPT